MGTNLVAVEDVGQLICSQLGVRADTGACPTYPHLPRGHRLKLKVPFPLSDGVGHFCPEEPHLVPWGALKAMASYRQTEG